MKLSLPTSCAVSIQNILIEDKGELFSDADAHKRGECVVES